MRAQIDRLQEPHVLATLQEHGCRQGAGLYERMMRGEFVEGSRQGKLCLALAHDPRNSADGTVDATAYFTGVGLYTMIFLAMFLIFRDKRSHDLPRE